MKLPSHLGHPVVLIPVNVSFQSVRIAALNCIHLFGVKLPKHKVLPHLDTVMRQIRKAMDDDKRCVRKKAVETRMQWSVSFHHHILYATSVVAVFEFTYLAGVT